MVTHDRYFLDNVADRILEMDGKGGIEQYEGGYTDYREARAKRQADSLDTPKGAHKREFLQNPAAKAVNQNTPSTLKFSFHEQW